MDVSQLYGTRLDFHFLRAEGFRCVGPEAGPFVAYSPNWKLFCVCSRYPQHQGGHLKLDQAWEVTLPLLENHIGIRFLYLWHGWQAELGQYRAMGDSPLEAGMRVVVLASADKRTTSSAP